jgi:hypothetical protein
MTPRLPEKLTTPLMDGAKTYESGRLSWQYEKKIRSEPAFTFSKPTPRFGRNMSGPPSSG